MGAGAGWHKAGPDQQLPPHVAWNQVSDAEGKSLDGSASAENISRGQQHGPAQSNSQKLSQGTWCTYTLIQHNAHTGHIQHNAACPAMADVITALSVKVADVKRFPCRMVNYVLCRVLLLQVLGLPLGRDCIACCVMAKSVPNVVDT